MKEAKRDGKASPLRSYNPQNLSGPFHQETKRTRFRNLLAQMDEEGTNAVFLPDGVGGTYLVTRESAERLVAYLDEEIEKSRDKELSKRQDEKRKERIMLAALTVKVHQAREWAEETSATLAALREAFAAAHAAEIEEARQAKAEAEKAEADLREATVEAYRRTGEKKPAEGLGIRVSRKLSYDVANAEEWARVNAPIALSLNVKKFEKLVEDAPPSFVTVEETATATIATDLSKAVEALGEVDVFSEAA